MWLPMLLHAASCGYLRTAVWAHWLFCFSKLEVASWFLLMKIIWAFTNPLLLSAKIFELQMPIPWSATMLKTIEFKKRNWHIIFRQIACISVFWSFYFLYSTLDHYLSIGVILLSAEGQHSSAIVNKLFKWTENQWTCVPTKALDRVSPLYRYAYTADWNHNEQGQVDEVNLDHVQRLD